MYYDAALTSAVGRKMLNEQATRTAAIREVRRQRLDERVNELLARNLLIYFEQ